MLDPYLFGISEDSDKPSYDGVVGRIDLESMKIIEAAGLQVVNLGVNQKAQHLPSMRIDSQAGAALAAEHLIAAGYKRFGYIGMPSKYPAAAKRHTTGMNKALAAQGF